MLFSAYQSLAWWTWDFSKPCWFVYAVLSPQIQEHRKLDTNNVVLIKNQILRTVQWFSNKNKDIFKCLYTFLIKTYESLYRKTNTYVAVKVIKNVEKYRFVHEAFKSHACVRNDVCNQGSKMCLPVIKEK